MNKEAYMRELEHLLRHLSDADRNDALEYYSEYIDDLGLGPADDVCARIGEPKEVARQIISQTTERKLEEQREKKTAKGSGSIIWLVILGIFASPVALPVAIAIVAIILAILITVGSVLFSFLMAGLAIGIAGLALCILSFFSGTVGQVLVAAGSGLFMVGLGTLIFIAVIKLAGAFVRAVGSAIRKHIAKKQKAEGGMA